MASWKALMRLCMARSTFVRRVKMLVCTVWACKLRYAGRDMTVNRRMKC